ncbi:MAG: type II toxin-antitoxin system RelE/ParE family toxin [Opitutales bacterium]|jgi:toxin HigB-1|nr:type II toxin-antitoxin system RelE/ParE family toxin [Opitutales bacterium]MDP4644129.1 type II toxin-antitoxin system RelE/ParE family toxin [Opitutales bacterium]MDP4778573.1 type II toxin-antitoxin system RelE/ParE family toxin [Opitutales bacterium]MDP4878770.1 type II toxin-antitoxin system RelE/ParE family toxin [Opitutales bacterium]MDP4883797.1 type II toxin-antitoxin system RelE/ParE family toxin [Opitutales bacterium]
MIRSFACKQTAALWDNQRHKKLPTNLQQSALRKLRLIESAIHLDDLKLPPGNRLEQLYGDRKGQHSIRINQQYRICFHFIDGHAEDVEIVDYH